MANGVRFIRVNGRVVPIKDNPAKEHAKIAGATAAGVGIAVATSKKAAAMMHESGLAEAKARHITKQYFGVKSAIKGDMSGHTMARMKAMGHAATGQAIKSKKLEKAAFRVRNIGTIATATAFGYAANKALDRTRLKDNPEAKTAVAAATGATATAAVYGAYLKGVGHRNPVTIAKLAIKRALRR